MKILQVTQSFKPMWQFGGVVRVSYEISKHLVDKGHDVTVYTTNRSFSKNIVANKPVDVEGIQTYYFENLGNYVPWKFFTAMPCYLPFIARKQIKEFDIVHIHEHRTFLAVIVHHYAKKYGIPYVLQAHGSVLPFFAKQKFKKSFDSIWGYNLLKDASKVIALNMAEVEQYGRMGLDKEKIEVVPNGIDLSKYTNLPKKGEFRKKYSIEDNEKIVLFLGRIHKIKGLDLLVNAFADLTKKMDNVRLAIVGYDGGFLPVLKKQIDDLNINDRILFTGPLYGADKLNAYVDADVYVLSSVYETFPNTVLESLVCGTPVVLTDRCGIADVVDKVAHVVEYDKNQLQDVLFRILIDEKTKNRFSESGKKLVKEEFNWDKIVKKVERIYENCLHSMK